MLSVDLRLFGEFSIAKIIEHKLRFGAVVALLSIFSVIFYFILTPTEHNASQVADTLSWERLGLLNLETGEVPDWLNSLNGQPVRVAGFVVPLEDEFRKITEFLLVPDPGSCIHVPPPPPNQIIFVKLGAHQTISIPEAPVWVTGTLNIKDVESPYGKVSYSLTDAYVKTFSPSEPYQQ